MKQEVIEAPESLDQATISTAHDERDEDGKKSPKIKIEAISREEQEKEDGQKKNSKICVVCEKEEGRYKCPRCSLP